MYLLLFILVRKRAYCAYHDEYLKNEEEKESKVAQKLWRYLYYLGVLILFALGFILFSRIKEISALWISKAKKIMIFGYIRINN